MKIHELFIKEDDEDDYPELKVANGPLLYKGYSIPYWKIYGKDANMLVNDIKIKLIHDLTNALGEKFSVQVYTSTFEVKADISDVADITKLSKDIDDTITSILQGRSLLSYINRGEARYYPIDAPLKHKIVFDNVRIFSLPLNDKNCTLRNIHNKIECKSLTIGGADEIVDGGLGILKIKHLQDVVFSWTKKAIGWDKIIEKHLKDKDILVCQEELIEAGFKEYARL